MERKALVRKPVVWAVGIAVLLVAWDLWSRGAGVPTSIGEMTVTKQTPAAMTVSVDYAYDGSQGEANIIALPLSDQSTIGAFGSKPMRMSRGRHRVELEIAYLKSEPSQTTGVKVEMYADGRDPFVVKLFEMERDWGPATR